MATIASITKRIKTDVKTKLPSTTSLLRNSMLMIFIEAVAGIFYTFGKGLDIIRRDSNVLTAPNNRLNKFGIIWGVTRKVSTKTTSIIQVSTTDVSIPSGTTFTDDLGLSYTSTEEAVQSNSIALVSIESTQVGYLDEPIEFISNNANYTNIEIISFIGGSEEEDDEDFRHRILTRIKYTPSGGSAYDYKSWLLELPNVTDAYVLPNELGFGTVLLGYKINGDVPTAMFDDQYIKDAIELKRPITAQVTVAKPLAKTINIEVAISPDNAEVRAAVINELLLIFKEKGQRESIFYQSWISEAISRATGENNHILITPASNTGVGSYELPRMGTVTFSDMKLALLDQVGSI